jgi:hypothetical protein
MSRIAKEYMEHQRKYWMRHDAHRFIRHDAWRFLPLSQRFEAKFDPNQPRVPTGSPEGGQWTANGGSAGAEAGIVGITAETLELSAARISSQRRAECEEQYRDDIFKCNLLRTRSCWAQAEFRKAQCLIGGYVPPIYF